MDDIVEAIDLCLSIAQKLLGGLSVQGDGLSGPAPEACQRFQWVERQVLSLLNKLASLQADLAAGLGFTEMGYSDPQELQDMLNDMMAQIQQLKALSVSVALDLSR